MKLLSLLLLTFIFASCGESPLFNHAMEKSGLGKDSFQTQADGFHFSKTSFSFSIDWITGPAKGENKFLIKTWHKDFGTLNGPYQDLPHDLHVYLWMPHMGHGSSPVKINKIADGEYEISDAYFIMGGKWEIFVQLLKNKDVVDEVILPISL